MKSWVTKIAMERMVLARPDRLYACALRACILNLIAQIALGTPLAAQTRGLSRPVLMNRQKEIALALSACPNDKEQGIFSCAAVNDSQIWKSDVRHSRS